MAANKKKLKNAGAFQSDYDMVAKTRTVLRAHGFEFVTYFEYRAKPVSVSLNHQRVRSSVEG